MKDPEIIAAEVRRKIMDLKAELDRDVAELAEAFGGDVRARRAAIEDIIGKTEPALIPMVASLLPKPAGRRAHLGGAKSRRPKRASKLDQDRRLLFQVEMFKSHNPGLGLPRLYSLLAKKDREDYLTVRRRIESAAKRLGVVLEPPSRAGAPKRRSAGSSPKRVRRQKAR
jgi:hypothetical protein